MDRLLITGGTGYLGSALLRLVHAQGWQVAATYYSQAPGTDADVIWIPLDVREPLAVEEALDAFQPKVVIHTAFRQYDPDLWAVTAEGAQHVAAAAALVGARLLHMSSDVIFNGERVGVYSEADAPDPITDYGAAKAGAERLVSASHPAPVIVRTSLIYGFTPMDRQTRFVLELADGLAEGRLFSDEYRCPVFVEDLAVALLELARGEYQGVINLAGTECLSRYEFGVLLAQAYGRDSAHLSPGLSAESLVRRPRNCALDTHLAQRLLHTRLRGVREVLAARVQSPDALS